MKPFKTTRLSPTVIRNALWNSAIITILYVLFNAFTYVVLIYQLERNYDTRIDHEIEHLLNAFYFDEDSLIVVNANELRESALVTIDKDPFFLQVYRLNGEELLSSPNLNAFEKIPYSYPEAADSIYFDNMEVAGELLRVGYGIVKNRQGDDKAIIQLSAPVSNAIHISDNMLVFNLVSFPLVLLIIFVSSVLLAKRTFKPIDNIVGIANKISAQNLSDRLSYKADSVDPLGRLRDTLNMLFDRLEKQFNQINEFTNNASHQLMTPLTVLRNEQEYILKHSALENESRESLKIMMEQTDQMIHIVRTLLLIARGEADNYAASNKVFTLSSVMDQLKNNYQRERRVEFADSGSFMIKGEREHFILILKNLIDNGLKYSPEDTAVHVKAQRSKGIIKITVCDHGMGISDSEKPLVFKKFYRTAAGENSGQRGYGLGLSLAYSLTHAMQGTLAVRDNKPQGTCFTLSITELKLK